MNALATMVLVALSADPAAGTAPHALTLQEAEASALLHHPALAQYRALVAQSLARYQQERSSYLPQVGLTASAGPGLTARPPDWRREVGGQSAIALSADQLLWDFGQTTGRIASAEEGVKSQQETLGVQRIDVLAGVRTAYFNALAAQEQLDVAQGVLDNQQKHLQQVEAFVRVGTKPEIDLAQARTDVANARVTQINAQNGVSVSLATLEQAMGVTIPRPVKLTEAGLPPLPAEGQNVDALVQDAISARGEIRALDLQIAGQRDLVRSAEGGYWPRLSVGATANDSGPSYLPTDNAVNVTGRVALQWTLFNGFGIPAQVNLARAALDQLVAQREALAQQVRLEVEQSYTTVLAATASLEAARDADANARERLRLAERRYELGLGNIIELSDAQVAQAQAAFQVVRARQDLSIARANLTRALGVPVP